VAFATSSPELVVAIQASLAGAPDMAVGNVVGSNICNVAIILGCVALVQPIPCHHTLIQREVPLVILVTGLFWLLMKGGLNRIEAAALASLLVLYTAWIYLAARRRPNETLPVETVASSSSASGSRLKHLALLALGLGALVLGANLLVDGAIRIAHQLGWSDAVIGLTVVALGTSMPEIATSIVAAFRGEPDIAVGNVLGSSLWNLLGVAGIAGMITPLPVEHRILVFDIPVALAFSAACLPIMRFDGRISRAEGMLLLLGYVVYVLLRLTWFAS
jgi:cation:H+ antiporter